MYEWEPVLVVPKCWAHFTDHCMLFNIATSNRISFFLWLDSVPARALLLLGFTLTSFISLFQAPVG